MWFREQKKRFAQEKKGLDDLASELWLAGYAFRYDAKSELLHVDVDINVDGELKLAVMTYPASYPDAPPYVRPRGDTVRWSEHQYLSGELCLQQRPDNWEPRRTGAEVLRSAYELLREEKWSASSGQLLRLFSDHHLSLGQELRQSSVRLVATKHLCDMLIGIEGCGALKISWTLNDQHVVLIPSSAVLASGETWKDPSLPKIVFDRSSSVGFGFHVLPGDPIGETLDWAAGAGVPTFRKLLLGADRCSLHDLETFIIMHSGKIRAFHMGTSSGYVHEVSVIQTDASRRVPASHYALRHKRVSIVGCGSVGSKVACMLTRAGVGSFYLVDHDVMKPENLVRNEMSWVGVGVHKVEALSEHLSRVDAEVKVDVDRLSLGGQESNLALQRALGELGKCDLIVDATANESAFNYISSVARKDKVAVLWAKVYAGGYGGMVARSRPGLDPSPTRMRAQIHQFFAERDFPIPAQPTQEYGAPNVDGEVMVADDADVTVVAAHLARFVIDALLRAEDSTFEQSVYFIGMRKNGMFNCAFDTLPLDVGRPYVESESADLSPEEESSVDAELDRIFGESVAGHD